MKMCDDCGLFPAEVHLTQIVERKSESLYLCTECAKKRDIHFAGEIPETPADPFESAENRECPKCRTILSDFRGNGRVGCPDCYRAFNNEIELLIKQVHGATDYMGKKYRSAITCTTDKVELSKLRKALESAVKDENFERAAALRDAIHNLNSKEGKCA
jgi:protein arginine kinase activator